MKTTPYFDVLSVRPDRAQIKTEWIQQVIQFPAAKMTQPDGRIRISGKIPAACNRWLRVILLDDRETVHNAFFDRRFDL